MPNDKKYKPEKDAKADDVLTAVAEIEAEDYLPLDLQIQRMAVLRDTIAAKVLALKAGL